MSAEKRYINAMGLRDVVELSCRSMWVWCNWLTHRLAKAKIGGSSPLTHSSLRRYERNKKNHVAERLGQSRPPKDRTDTGLAVPGRGA